MPQKENRMNSRGVGSNEATEATIDAAEAGDEGANSGLCLGNTQTNLCWAESGTRRQKPREE